MIFIAVFSAISTAVAAIQKYWDINGNSHALFLVATQYKDLKLQTRELLMKYQFFQDDQPIPMDILARSMKRYTEISTDELRFTTDAPSRQSKWMILLCCCHAYHVGELTMNDMTQEFSGDVDKVTIEDDRGKNTDRVGANESGGKINRVSSVESL